MGAVCPQGIIERQCIPVTAKMHLAVNDHILVQNYLTNTSHRCLWLSWPVHRLRGAGRPIGLDSQSSDAETTQFVDAVRGSPLRVEEENDYLNIINTPDLSGWWDGSLERDRLIEHCRQVVELWETWDYLVIKCPQLVSSD